MLKKREIFFDYRNAGKSYRYVMVPRTAATSLLLLQYYLLSPIKIVLLNTI